MTSMIRDNEFDVDDGTVQQFCLDQEVPQDSQNVNYSIKFSASIFQQVLSASAGKAEDISIVFDSEKSGSVFIGNDKQYPFELGNDGTKEFYVPKESLGLDEDQVLTQVGTSSGRINVKHSTDAVSNTVSSLATGGKLTSKVPERTHKPAVVVGLGDLPCPEEPKKKKARTVAPPIFPARPLSVPLGRSAPPLPSSVEKYAAKVQKKMPSRSIFDNDSIAAEKVPPLLVGFKFPPVVVFRHLPGFVTEESIRFFFDGLKFYDAGASDWCGVWSVPSSLPRDRPCDCVSCSRAFPGGIQLAEENRYDIYVHFPSSSSASVALLRDQEPITIKIPDANSAGESRPCFGHGATISCRTCIEEVSVEEQCWLYLVGFPVWQQSVPVSFLAGSLKRKLNNISDVPYLLSSIADMSIYWRKMGFKLRNFRNLVHRVTPLCRHYEIDVMEAAVEEERKNSSKKRKRVRKKKNNTTGPQWIKHPDWILSKYCYFGYRCEESCYNNRLLRESDEFAKLNKVLIRRNPSALSKQLSSHALLATEDVDSLKSVQLVISDAMSRMILDVYEPPATDPDISAEYQYLNYLDRVLYLFNLLEVWSMRLEVIVLPVDSHTTS